MFPRKGSFLFFLAVIIILSFPKPAITQQVSSYTFKAEYTGYLQIDEGSIILWKKPLLNTGQNGGRRIILSTSAADSLGSIEDMEFKEVILSGIFQQIGNKIICLQVNIEDFDRLETAKTSAKEAEEKLRNVRSRSEGYISVFPDSIIVYDSPYGNTVVEAYKYDSKTFFVGIPRDSLHTIEGTVNLKLSVGFRPAELDSTYTCGYINIQRIK